MSVALRRYGSKFMRYLQREERIAFREIQQYIREEMQPALIGRVMLLVDKVFKNDRFSLQAWKSNRRFFLNIAFPKVFNDFDTWFGKIAINAQKKIYYNSRKMLLDELKEIGYPMRFYKTSLDVEKEFAKMKFIEEIDLSALDLIDRKNSEEGFWLCNGDERVWISEAMVSVPVGTGKLSSEFLSFLKRQFIQGADPRNRIVTFTTAQVNELERLLLRDISKGLDPTVTRSKFVRKLLKGVVDPKLRKKLEFNSMRIMRTSMSRAASASVSMFALQNKKIISHLERVANGRPCLACQIVDGTRYPPGATLDDHIMGLCIFVPRVKTLEELGFDKEKVSPKLRAGFSRQQRGYVLWKDKFLSMSEAEQRKVFANNALYDLWKRERFPLEKLVVKRQGMTVPITYKEAVSKVANWPTVSNPSAQVVNLQQGARIEKFELGQGQSFKDYFQQKQGLDNKAATSAQEQAQGILGSKTVTMDDLVRAYTPEGYELREVAITFASGQRINFTAKIVKREVAGDISVGEIVRDFIRSGENLIVRHEAFYLQPEFRGKGIAKEIFKKNLRFYDALGVKKIELTAGGDVGIYAWAKYGFDFASYDREGYIETFRNALARYIKNKTGVENVDLGEFKHSWDFATFDKTINGVRVTGKDFMLQRTVTWEGELDLSKDAIGRKILENYLGIVTETQTGRKLTKAEIQKFLRKVDPYDNTKGSHILFREHFPEGVNPDTLLLKDVNGGNGFGLGMMELSNIQKAKPELWGEIDEIFKIYGSDLEKLPLFKRNELMRKLGLFKRWADDGTEYWVLNGKEMDELRKILKIEGIGAEWRKFDTVDEMRRWGRDHFLSWLNSLSKEEKGALLRYRRFDYAEMNRFLRGEQERVIEPMKRYIQSLQEALNRVKIPENIVTYRGMNLKSEIFEKYSKIGATIKDDGFISSSLDPEVARQFGLWGDFIIELHIPKGTPGAYVSHREREILLSPGRTFKVVGKEKMLLGGKEYIKIIWEVIS